MLHAYKNIGMASYHKSQLQLFVHIVVKTYSTVLQPLDHSFTSKRNEIYSVATQVLQFLDSEYTKERYSPGTMCSYLPMKVPTERGVHQHELLEVFPPHQERLHCIQMNSSFLVARVSESLAANGHPPATRWYQAQAS